MIEIIEHGTKQTRKCKACGCKFSFENVDIEHSTHCDFGNFSYDYVICPQCKQKIILVDTKLMLESNFEKCNGCPYYYGEIDQCMIGEDGVPDNLEKKCEKGVWYVKRLKKNNSLDNAFFC